VSFPAERRNGPEPSEPCGTLAAYRRHYRRGEPPCDACRIAHNRDAADRDGRPQAPVRTPDRRAVRNAMPLIPRYSWQARAYPWAQRVLAAAEAVHGPPVPTCLRCARPINHASTAWRGDGICYACAGTTP